MNIKEFCKKAIEHGYGDELCSGWDWIGENLSELDYIFQTPEYKEKNGMKYLCMPLIIGNEELSEIEIKILGTTWYLNNKRERKAKEKAYAEKMLNEGWVKLTEEAVKMALDEKKKVIVNAISVNDWLSTKIDMVYKPAKYSDGALGLMKPKARNRGYRLHQFENAFCKII